VMHDGDIDAFRRLLDLYQKVDEPEFEPLRDEFIRECEERLKEIALDKKTEVAGSDYYLWLTNMLENRQKNEEMRAVSVMDESAWVTIEAERKYLDANIEAARNGVVVRRVFITTRERMSKKENLVVLRKHFENSRRRMQAYLLYTDELKRRDSKLDAEVGHGFSLFGGRVVLTDSSAPPDVEARGSVSMNIADIERCKGVFERLGMHWEEVNESLLQKLEASAV
jgi:hypothetical protein